MDFCGNYNESQVNCLKNDETNISKTISNEYGCSLIKGIITNKG